MDIQTEIERLGSEIKTAESELIQLKARLAGLRAQRDALAAELARIVDENRPAQSQPLAAMPDLKTLDRTDAIVEVLRVSGRSMSIQEVWDSLKAGGRSEPGYQVIASTLNFLNQKGRITKPSRGRYAA